MKNIISKHKIEIVYIVVILLVIIYGTVTAHAEVSSNIAEEPQIVIKTDVNEETEPETTTPDSVPKESEEEPPKEVGEDVESETVDKKVSENIADMVINELLPEEQQQVENGDLSELIDIMKTIVTLLFAEIVGIGLLLGSVWCGKAFRWLQ